MIRLSLPLPPSTNDLYQRELGFTKHGRPYRATRLKPRVESFRWAVAQAITAQLTAEQVKTVPPVMAITVLLREDCCHMDPDNALKSIIDAIKGPLGFDDNPRRVRRVAAEYHGDRALGPCMVVIEEVRP